MATRYKIDRKRVYWSGFSMVSMLLFHCMPNMLDKIAAFAPTSGIQFSEEPWKKCAKKVNVMECIAYNKFVRGFLSSYMGQQCILDWDAIIVRLVSSNHSNICIGNKHLASISYCGFIVISRFL